MAMNDLVKGLNAASELTGHLLTVIKDLRNSEALMSIFGAEIRISSCEHILICLGCRIAAEMVRINRPLGANDPRYKEMMDRSSISLVEALEGREHMLTSAIKMAREQGETDENIALLEGELAAYHARTKTKSPIVS